MNSDVVFGCRCFDQVAVPGVHDIRAEVVPGRAAVRACVVLRPRPRVQPQGQRQEDPQRQLPADVPRPVPRGERVRLQVGVILYLLHTI